jgi:hypothetical protein
MFNFFKSKVLVTEVAEAFPAWARSLRVCLYTETDKTYRELIVNYLRILSVMQVPIRGDEWFGSDDKQRIEKILLVYGPEFPEEADPVKFGQMVHDFHQNVFSKK